MSKWQILVVDDEQEILDSTMRALKGFSYKDNPIEIRGVTSLSEATKAFEETKEWSVVILDVVLGKNEIGLSLVPIIREKFLNLSVQIILRTGQPSDIPEIEVLRKYDIREYLNKNSTDRQRLVLSLLSALKSYEKEAMYEIAVKTEVSKNADLQEKLAESEKLAAIATLSAGINHEVGNALNGMAGGIAILDKEIKKKSSGEETDLSRLQLSRDKFREGITRAQEIIEGLSIAVRTDNVKKSYFNLFKNVKQGIGLMSDKVEKNNVKISVAIPGNVEIEYNQTAIIQIWMNLISNACDAMEHTKNPRIEIIGKELGREYFIEVTDNGPGIKDGNKIFDALFTTKDPGKGTGLGLYAVKSIVANLGGEISFDKNYTSGAKFVLKVPVFKYAEEETSSNEPMVEKSTPKPIETKKESSTTSIKAILVAKKEFSQIISDSTTKLHVVHLDDEQSALDTVKELAPSNWDIHSFTDIDQCLEYLKSNFNYKQNIDFFLCDINMGKNKGVEVMQGRDAHFNIIGSEHIYYLTAYDPSEIPTLKLRPMVSHTEGPIRKGGMIKKPLKKEDIAYLNRKYLSSKGDFSYIMPRVLLIDDEKQNHDSFKEMAPENWQIHCIDNPKKFLEQIKKFAPHCIVTDIDMPGLNGSELVEIIRETSLDIPILGLSAHSEEIAKTKYKWDNLPFFQKPVTKALFENCWRSMQGPNLVLLQYPEKISDIKMLYNYYQDYLEFSGDVEGKEGGDPWQWSGQSWDKARAKSDEMATLEKAIGLSPIQVEEIFSYAKTHPRQARPKNCVSEGPEKKKIMVIDDNKNLTDLFTQVFGDEYTIECYQSLESGFERIHMLQPNLILIDINMPGIAEVTIEQIIKNLPELNIIIHSGHSYGHVTEVLGLDIPECKFHWKTGDLIDPSKYLKPWKGKVRSYKDVYMKFGPVTKNYEAQIEERKIKDVTPLVFVFDDESSNLDAFLEYAPKEWRVFCFNDPTQDIMTITNLKPHILVTDQKMPKTTGANLVLAGYFTGAVLQMFILSAFDKEEVEKDYERLGLKVKYTQPKFFKKPISDKLIQDIDYSFNSYPRKKLAEHSNIDIWLKQGREVKISCYATNQPSMMASSKNESPKEEKSAKEKQRKSYFRDLLKKLVS